MEVQKQLRLQKGNMYNRGYHRCNQSRDGAMATWRHKRHRDPFRGPGREIVASILTARGPPLVFLLCFSFSFLYPPLITWSHVYRLLPSKSMKPVKAGSFEKKKNTSVCILQYTLSDFQNNNSEFCTKIIYKSSAQLLNYVYQCIYFHIASCSLTAMQIASVIVQGQD